MHFQASRDGDPVMPDLALLGTLFDLLSGDLEDTDARHPEEWIVRR